MSFSDMMSSGRGPGIIGMVMALIVLLGFGLLFMYASDESGPGGQSIESVISHQGKDIEGYKANIAQGRKNLELAPGRMANSREVSRLKLANEAGKASIADTTQKGEAGRADLAALENSFEGYKDQYRAFARGQAKGESMERLETLSGAVYKNVNIREVTAIGIQIRHDEGQKRIAFEDLPDKMKDRFQFDPKQKEKAVAAEAVARNEHDAAAAVANEQAGAVMEAQRVRDAAEAKEKFRMEIVSKEAQIASLKSEITSLERDRDRAIAEAAAARAAGRMHTNKSSSMGSNIRAKQGRLASLQAEVARMKASL